MQAPQTIAAAILLSDAIYLLKSLAIDQLIWQILNNKSKLKKPKKYFLVDYSDSNYTKGVIIFVSDGGTTWKVP